jgi:hypothetical protein
VIKVVADYFAEHSAEIEARIRRKIEDAQLSLLDDLYSTVKAGYLQRIGALEAEIRRNEDVLAQIRRCSDRTNDDLRRLSEGIHRLTSPHNEVCAPEPSLSSRSSR